ncbi:TPA: LysR family transcriptional regulator, partial [Klebsiella quasipneumoniae subsp. similipneumoniae]|nr:LysR family transcriptional regulator [Klebsiella quasipneumoniae subsp. similipneumoniae]
MNLKQLYYFKRLSETEHYTEAASSLCITQPSLSHAISELEK